MAVLVQGNNEINVQMTPIAVGNTVQVALLNIPKLMEKADEWQLIIYDWNGVHLDSQYYIPITKPAIFELLPGTVFPLRVDMILFHDIIVYYRMQSVGEEFPFPHEWYVEAFIPDYGSYYYNVNEEIFEPA